MYIVSLLHALFTVSLTFYSFLFTRSKYDYLILFIIFTMSWCWSLYKGECFISYYLKKLNDPSYEMGSNVVADDLHVIFGDQNKEYVKFFFSTIYPVGQTVNIYLLTKRNSFSSVETVLYPLVFYTYFHSTFLKSSFINNCFAILFTYILYRIVKYSTFI